MIPLFVIVLVAVTLSALLKDMILTNILGIAIFIGPLIMEWSGLHKIHFLSMNALLDAHQLLQGRWDMLILQVLVFGFVFRLQAAIFFMKSMTGGSETDEISDKRLK